MSEGDIDMTQPNGNPPEPDHQNAPASAPTNGYASYGQTAYGQPGYGQYAAPAPAADGTAYPQTQPASPYEQPGYGSGAAYDQYGRQPTKPAPEGAYGQPYGAPPVPGGAPVESPYGTPAPTPYGQPYGQQVPEAAPAPYAQPYGAPPAYGDYAPQTAATWQGEPPLDQPYPGIGFGGAIKRFFTKYATFSGRASRSEFWWVYLFTCIVNMVISFPTRFLESGSAPSYIFMGLEGLWSLAILVPTIALWIRRLHDSNLSGWFVLLPYGLSGVGLILLVGSFFIAFGGSLPDALSGDTASLSQSDIATMGIGALLSLLLMAIGGIMWIVFGVRRSNPEGARFDK